MSKLSKIIYYLILTGLILFSFFNFSERFYPFLNSDYAINVLMAYKLNLPQDLYFWGQDRGGSILPILSNLVIKLTSLSPIISVSIVHYIILISGFFALSAFFKKPFIKILLAVVWFYANWYHAAGFLLNFYGLQFSIMNIGLYFLKRMMETNQNSVRYVYLNLSFIILIISVWVSDLSIIAIGLIASFAIFLFFKFNSRIFKALLKPINVISVTTVILWGIVGLLFIRYAKSHVPMAVEDYKQLFNSSDEMLFTINVIIDLLKDMLLFKGPSILMNIFIYLILLCIPLVILLSKPTESTEKHKYAYVYFFLIFTILNLLVIIVSHWVFLNDIGRRYFTITYISAAVTALLYIDVTTSKHKIFRLLIVSLVFICAGFSSLKCMYFPKHLQPVYESVKEFNKLGECGLIGDYWNSYLYACGNPGSIVPTPHDASHCRNYFLQKEVFKQPKIFLVKYNWLDSYPDTMIQYGFILVRKGDEFKIANKEVCEYEVLK